MPLLASLLGFEHMTPVLHDLLWLPIRHRIMQDYHIGIQVYARHGAIISSVVLHIDVIKVIPAI